MTTDTGLRRDRRRTLLVGMLGTLGVLSAAVGIPFLGRRILEYGLFSRWRRSQQKIFDEAARVEAENSHGHHSGLALLTDARGFTLLGTTRRGRELGWLLRVDPDGRLIWERTLPELDDPALLVRDGDGYLITGSQDETGGARRSYAAAVQKVSSDGNPGPVRVHPPGGVSTFFASAESGGHRYLAGQSGHQARIAERREDLSLSWDRAIPELFQITCLLPRPGGLLALGATEYNTRGPHRGAILLLRESGEVERVIPLGPQGAKGGAHLARAVHLPDGRMLAVGSVQEEEAGATQGWLVELDAQGGVREHARTGSRLTAIAASADGGFDVAGIELAGLERRVLLRHCAPTEPAQDVRLEPERGAWVADLAVLPDGDRVLIGTTTRLGKGKTNLWLARVTRGGALRWERGYGEP